jgi:hypothetical protein
LIEKGKGERERERNSISFIHLPTVFLCLNFHSFHVSFPLFFNDAFAACADDRADDPDPIIELVSGKEYLNFFPRHYV